jgi:hypothetical protein
METIAITGEIVDHGYKITGYVKGIELDEWTGMDWFERTIYARNKESMRVCLKNILSDCGRRFRQGTRSFTGMYEETILLETQSGQVAIHYLLKPIRVIKRF